MSKKRRAGLNKRLIAIERKLRKVEKDAGIKSPKWSVRVNPRNIGGKTKSSSLTDMQIKFCEEYPKDLNGTQSAIRAGYSENGAGVVASNLLKLDKIRAKIEQLNKGRLKRLNITVENTLREIALIAFANITDVCKWTTKELTLKKSSSLSRQETAAIKSITETVTPKATKLKVELYDKPQGLLMLCRYMNLLDGNAKVVDADATAKRFKEAFNDMFDSVPTSDPSSTAGSESTATDNAIVSIVNGGTIEPEYVMED